LAPHVLGFSHQRATLERFLRQRQQFFKIEGLLDEVEGAGFDCFDRGLHGPVASDNDHFRIWLRIFHVTQQG
jgi:hypothetical protein